MLNSNPKFRKEIKKRNKIRKNSGPNIGKEPDLTNPEDLPEYIQLFTHLFNKKFEKLPKKREWDYEINLIKDTSKELNSRIKFMIYNITFLYPKKRQIITIGIRLQKTEPIHDKEQDTINLDWKSN